MVGVDDPWGWGRSLEWATCCPPPRHNFVSIPRIRSESPAFDLHHPEVAALEMAENDALGDERDLVDAPTSAAARHIEEQLGTRSTTDEDERPMKAEAWIFAICTVFFVLVAPAYWFITGDPTGTSALTMTFLLTAAGHASTSASTPPRWSRVPRTARTPRSPTAPASSASSRRTAGGRCGAALTPRPSACSASRWAPGGCSSSASALGALALCGWIYEYYVGEHAH